MSVDKKVNYDVQGGVKNYLGKQKTVTVPKDWQSSPDHPTTELAYITKAEKDVLEARSLSSTPGLRLSCQIACNEDMELKAVSRLEGSGRADAGGRPGDEIEPPPEWC